jgi:DNA-binding response OmpR family regulator
MQQTSARLYAFGDFALDLGAGSLHRRGEEVKLRPKAFETLRYLVKNPGRLVSKEELIRAVWADAFVTDNSLVKCLKAVRAALGDEAHTLIKTVPRRGYIWLQQPDGGPARALTALAADRWVATFAWSPDGKTLAYTRTNTTAALQQLK